MRNSRFLPVALLAVVLSALVGGFYGSVLARQDEVTQQYRVFTAALAAIDREYVEEVPSDRLVYGAIDGMLQDARSALELLRSRASTRRCASARKAATTASASRFSRSTATSP